MSRGHQRKACLGGSAVTADPLVTELASNAEHVHSASLLYESSEPQLVAEVLEGAELVDLDEVALIQACEQGDQSAERTGVLQADVNEFTPAHVTILELMRSVELPTVRALRTGNLQSLDAAIRLVSQEDAAELWAALHVMKGVALRLRASGKSHHQQAKALTEASRSFDQAFSVYATLRANALDAIAAASMPPVEERAVPAEDIAGPPPHQRATSRPSEPCANERDGSALVARAVAGPVVGNSRLLERAITCLRVARAAADPRTWVWITTTNNLACALTLLGNRYSSGAGLALLREAVRVLHEALRAHAAGIHREDRALTLVNLSETLVCIAERETPDMRVKKVQRACAASAAALRTVLPLELAWLVRLDHRDVE